MLILQHLPPILASPVFVDVHRDAHHTCIHMVLNVHSDTTINHPSAEAQGSCSLQTKPTQKSSCTLLPWDGCSFPNVPPG